MDGQGHSLPGIKCLPVPKVVINVIAAVHLKSEIILYYYSLNYSLLFSKPVLVL